MTRVLIATADGALRNALKLILRQRLPMSVVGESATKADLDASLAQLQPDLLLVDLGATRISGPAKLASYQAACPAGSHRGGQRGGRRDCRCFVCRRPCLSGERRLTRTSDRYAAPVCIDRQCDWPIKNTGCRASFARRTSWCLPATADHPLNPTCYIYIPRKNSSTSRFARSLV